MNQHIERLVGKTAFEIADFEINENKTLKYLEKKRLNYNLKSNCLGAKADIIKKQHCSNLSITIFNEKYELHRCFYLRMILFD